ncbi:MAG TPA: hypothetical protein V6C69_19845 [Trichormus sp.]
MFKRRAGIALTVAILFCSRVEAGEESFQSYMDDGRSADVIQNFSRAEVAYAKAYQLAQKSNNQRDVFLSLAPFLCAKIVQHKYNDAEPLYMKLNELAKVLKQQNKLDGDMLEDIDDICDAYSSQDKFIKDLATDPTYALRMERSLKLRMQFLKTSRELITNEKTMIGWHLRRREFDKARELIEFALSNSSNMRPIDIAIFQTDLSCILGKTGATQKAQALQKRAFAKCQQLNDLGDYYAELARYSSICEDLKTAIKFATQSIKYYESPIKPLELTDELTERASWKYIEKDFAGAQADYQRAVVVAKQSAECWRELPPCYRGLAEIMHAEHSEKQANQYLMLEKAATKQARKLEAKDFHDLSGDFEAAKQDLKSGR